jgi:anti-anti-sigma factor
MAANGGTGRGVSSQLAELLAEGPGDDATAEQLVELALRSTAADHAGLTLFPDGRPPEPATATDPLVGTADQLQRALDEGPSVDASAFETMRVSGDLERESRWPHWGAAMSKLGIHSMLSVPITVSDTTTGTLNLYSSRRSAFAAEHVALAEMIAEHAALPVARLLDARALREGLDERTLLGHAHGVLMQRLGLTAPEAAEAFDRYRRRHRVAPRDLAARIVGSPTAPQLLPAPVVPGSHTVSRVYSDTLVEITGDGVSLRVLGEIDLSNSKAWQRVLVTLAARAAGADAHLDLTDLSFIGVAGARELVTCAELLSPGRLHATIQGGSGLRKIIDLCGWDQIESLVWQVKDDAPASR